MSVWCVWTEWGSYSDFSRDLRGIFATHELADAHAAQLQGDGHYDVVEVVEDEIAAVLPRRVPYVRYAAHICADGTEDQKNGYHRGTDYSTWDNELKPLDRSKILPWSSRGEPDMFIEVIGSDEIAVAAEYDRLLKQHRDREAIEVDRRVDAARDVR